MGAAAAFAVNWVLASLLLAPEPRTPVSYTFFREQVQAGNVSDDHFHGRHDRRKVQAAVGHPPGGPDAAQVRRFQTQRPAFADDQLMGLLLERGVTVIARPPDQVPLWQQLLVGFGPTLLLIGLLVYLFQRGTQGLTGGLGGSARPAPSGTPPSRAVPVATAGPGLCLFLLVAGQELLTPGSVERRVDAPQGEQAAAMALHGASKRRPGVVAAVSVTVSHSPPVCSSRWAYSCSRVNSRPRSQSAPLSMITG